MGAGLGSLINTVYEIERSWEGKGHDDCTYWVVQRMNGDFTTFAADQDGVVTIEARGTFGSYRSAREYLKHAWKFEGRLKRVN